MATIREARAGDAAGIARVHVDSWRTTYPGIMPAEYLASLSYEQREQVWHDLIAATADGRQAVFVAEASLLLWVARDNPSRAFYESLGGTAVRERRAELFGQTIDEVGYGWNDLSRLLNAT